MASSGILPPITFEEEKRIDDLESRFYSQSYAFRIDRTLYIFPCPDHTSEEPNVAHNVEEGVEEKEKFHHFSSIPNEALQYLEKSSQILLFSGETGSGKTLLCQKILSYFCEKSSSSPDIDNTLEEKITMIAPILELFSHAQTFQSLNSSRIAKLFKFRFKNDRVQALDISCSLLEKNRVIFQNDGESNFHIFYLLFLNELQRNFEDVDLLLTDEIEYRYIYPKDRLQDPDDTKFLQDRCSQLIQGLNAIGITTALQMQLFQAIAGIILLGNIQFRPIDQNVKKGVSLDSVECCVDEDDPILQNIASLLGKDDIANIFTAKVIQGGRASIYKVTLTGAQSIANVDSLAQGLYLNIFNWIISKINETLHQNMRQEDATSSKKLRGPKVVEPHYLSLFDMIGFEDYGRMNGDLNGFDQFLMNYCNEKLHSIFYTDIFLQENQLFLDEGCPYWTQLGYDNTDCLSLYENDRGLLKLIDEHCLLSRAHQDDLTLLTLICNTISTSPTPNQHFSCSLLQKKKVTGEDTFTIKHYLGETRYCIQGFTAGNIEKSDMEEFMKQSTNEVIAVSLKSDEEETQALPSEPTRTRGGRNLSRQSSSTSVATRKVKKTRCQLVRNNLNSILSDFTNSRIYFIKCIKPSDDPSLQFNRSLVCQQLRAAGFFDLMRMKFSGYVHRYSWNNLLVEFVNRGCISSLALTNVTDPKDYLRKLLRSSYIEPKLWFEGNSGLVYLQSTLFDCLMQQRVNFSAAVIQKNWRTNHLQRYLTILVSSLGIVKSKLLSYLLRRRYLLYLENRRRLERSKHYLLKRWQFVIKLRKRSAVTILIRILLDMRAHARISHILRAQETICNFLQTKRLRKHFLLMKKSALRIQTSSRGLICRKKYLPLRLEVKARMHRRLCDFSATKISRCYRNHYLKQTLAALFLAVRWKDFACVIEILTRNPSFVNVRDATSGYKSLLHLSVECELLLLVEWLLSHDVSPYCFDVLGNTPLMSLPVPPTNVQHAQILRAFITFHRNIFDFPIHEELLFDDINHYIQNEKLSNIPCLSSTLGEVLRDIQRTKKRAIAKAKHKEAMRRGSTIIPLYDPSNWEDPLPECLPAPNNAYVDIGVNRRASLMSLQMQPMTSDHETPQLDEMSISDISAGNSISETASDSSRCDENQWAIPPRRKRNFNQQRYLSTLLDSSSALDQPAGTTSTPMKQSSSSSKTELLSPSGAVNSIAVYKSLFISEPRISKRGSKSSEQIPLSWQHIVTPTVGGKPSPQHLKSITPLKHEIRATLTSSPTPSPVPSPSPKKKPTVQEKEPIYKDPQYRMLLARKMAVEKDPVLNFLIKTRPAITPTAPSKK